MFFNFKVLFLLFSSSQSERIVSFLFGGDIYGIKHFFMLDERRLDEIITEEITKADVERIAINKVNDIYRSKEFKKAVKELTADVIENLYKTLWQKSSTWKGGISR